MGRLTVNGLDGIIDDFSELAKLPDSVITDILNAEADLIVQAQRTEIESRWKGPHSLGISAKSVKKGQKKPKRAVYHGIPAGEPQTRRAFHTQRGNRVYQRVRGAWAAYRRPPGHKRGERQKGKRSDRRGGKSIPRLSRQQKIIILQEV